MTQRGLQVHRQKFSSPIRLQSHLPSVWVWRCHVATYSAYKLAENFKLLVALLPGKNRCGNRARTGGMPWATYALHNGNYRDVNKFPEQVDDLLMYLHDTIPEDHPYHGLKATPVTESIPPVWMLGSSLFGMLALKRAP